jgi:two-component system response regulator ChvI
MKKILVVDDDEAFCRLIKLGMDETKYEVNFAHDGLEGLDAVTKNPPDLILLDVKMPRMGGMEFLEKLHESDSGRSIPILITSNDSSLDTISRGTELGVRGYIVKSNQPIKDILSAVERIFTEVAKK